MNSPRSLAVRVQAILAVAVHGRVDSAAPRQQPENVASSNENMTLRLAVMLMRCPLAFQKRARRGHGSPLLVAASLIVVWSGAALATDREPVPVENLATPQLDETAGVISMPVPFGVEWRPHGLWVTSITNQCVYQFDRGDKNPDDRVGFFPSRWSVCGGSGEQGFSGDGGPAKHAAMNWPHEVRVNGRGDLYVADTRNHVIRVIDASDQTIHTVAGSGEAGYADSTDKLANSNAIDSSKKGNPKSGQAAFSLGHSASFDQPHSVVLLDDSMLLVADTKNHRIRQVDLPSGKVTTFCGDGRRELPKEGQARSEASLFGPRSLAVDDESVWIALREGNSIWRLDRATDKLHRIAGTGQKGYEGDGSSAKQATLRGPKGLAIDGLGRVLIVDTENHCVRRVDVAADRIETVLGGRLASESMTLKRPHGIAAEPQGGTFWVADSENDRLIRWTPDE